METEPIREEIFISNSIPVSIYVYIPIYIIYVFRDTYPYSHRIYPLYIDGKREIHFKNLAHMIMEAWQVQNMLGGQVDWEPMGELQLEFKGSCC